MKIVVIGGTNFFGKHLVQTLLDENHEVFVFSRSKKGLNSFRGKFTHIQGDRKIEQDLLKIKSYGTFDVLYDQICMNGSEAKLLCDVLGSSIKKLIFTSTGSVYDFKNSKVISEEDFDYHSMNLKFVDPDVYDYQYAKRMCEAIYQHELKIPVICVRFTLVIGENDYTKRFFWHLERVFKDEPIYFPNLEAKLCFIEEEDAGKMLANLKDKMITGPINAVASGSIKMSDFMSRIELALGKKAIYKTVQEGGAHSPYGSETDFMMSNEKAISLNIPFKSLNQTVDGLIHFYSKTLKES